MFGDKMMKCLNIMVILLYLVSILFPKIRIEYFLSILCLIIVVSTLFSVKRFVRILGLLFLVLGSTLLWSNQANWQDYIRSFGPMLDLITMFILLPILGIPVKLGGYSDDIQSIIKRKVKTAGHLYRLTSGISYFFSVFMNLATLPMMYHSIRPALRIFSVKNEERFMSRAITHGYAMPLMWAPVTPIVGVVISVTGVNWISVLPFILPISIFGLALDWYLGARRGKEIPTFLRSVSNDEIAATTSNDDHSNARRVFHILWAILIFNIVITIAEFQLSFSFLTLVSLLVIPFAFTWSLLLKKTKEFYKGLKTHFSSFAITMRDQFFIYLSAGFFISAIKISHTNDLLNAWIGQFKGIIGGELFLILLPLIPLVFAFLGLHPAVTVTLMAEALNPKIIGISPTILSVAMLAGAVSAFLVGPYNATIGLMSSIVKKSSLKVSHWNMSYTCLYICGVMVYLFLLEYAQKYVHF